MRKEVVIGFFLLFILLVMPLVLTIETEVKIKTIPHHEVQVSAVKDGQMIEHFSNISDGYGDASFVFTFDRPDYDLFVFIKKDNENVITPYKAINSVTGESVYLELAPGWFEFIETPETESEINETEINETEIISGEETSENNKSKIVSMAGAAVSKIKENKSILIYVGIGVLVIVIIVLFFMHKKGSNVPMNVTKLSEIGKGLGDESGGGGGGGKLQGLKDEIDEMRHEMR